MGFNYKLTEQIIKCFNEEDINGELDTLVYLDAIDSDTFIEKLLIENQKAIIKPERYTLLHTFIEYYLYYYLNHERYFFFDLICCDLEVDNILSGISDIVKILNEYGIIMDEYETQIIEFDKKFEESDYTCREEYMKLLKGIYDVIFENFDAVEEDIVEAVFYLLYSNKEFLFCFNQFIANYVTTKYLSSELFDRAGHIKRCSYIPEWLRRAVFYRDNGKCQHCGMDLSGFVLINPDRQLQINHIIPLENGGTNDATNFQLLCEVCNLQKGGTVIRPNYFYQMYW